MTLVQELPTRFAVGNYNIEILSVVMAVFMVLFMPLDIFWLGWWAWQVAMRYPAVPFLASPIESISPENYLFTAYLWKISGCSLLMKYASIPARHKSQKLNIIDIPSLTLIDCYSGQYFVKHFDPLEKWVAAFIFSSGLWLSCRPLFRPRLSFQLANPPALVSLASASLMFFFLCQIIRLQQTTCLVYHIYCKKNLYEQGDQMS